MSPPYAGFFCADLPRADAIAEGGQGEEGRGGGAGDGEARDVVCEWHLLFSRTSVLLDEQMAPNWYVQKMHMGTSFPQRWWSGEVADPLSLPHL